MCKEGQSLLIDRGKGNVGKVLREQHPSDIFRFGGNGNSGNPGRVPGIVRVKEIRGVVLVDEEIRVCGR